MSSSQTKQNKPQQTIKLRHYFEYYSARITGFFAGLVPRSLWPLCARFFSFLWFFIFPVRRNLVLQNLSRAFPQSDIRWQKQTARACYAHFLQMMLFEFIFISRKGTDGVRTLISEEVEGLTAAKDAGMGTKAYLVLGAHMGNWELAIHYFAGVLGFKATAVHKPMHNPLVEDFLSRQRSTANWKQLSSKHLDGREIISAVRQNNGIVLLADQDARSQGLFVPFFSVPASTADGPARLAIKLKLPVFFVSCLKGDDGKYHARLESFPPRDSYPKDNEEAVRAMTKEYMNKVENAVRQAPEQYFWFHKRWKTQPKTSGN